MLCALKARRSHKVSGGNVQRVVLARELAANIKILVVANPVLALDF